MLTELMFCDIIKNIDKKFWFKSRYCHHSEKTFRICDFWFGI